MGERGPSSVTRPRNAIATTARPGYAVDMSVSTSKLDFCLTAIEGKKHPERLQAHEVVFCREFCVDLNATKAALRAGYSEHSAANHASGLLNRPRIKRYIEKLMADRLKRVDVRADDVVAELAKIAFGDLRGVFDEQGQLLPPHEWPDDAAAAIASMEATTAERGQGDVEHVVKVRQWDKLRALELLGKHLKMFTDRVEHDVADGLADRLAAARKRVENTAERDAGRHAPDSGAPGTDDLPQPIETDDGEPLGDGGGSSENAEGSARHGGP